MPTEVVVSVSAATTERGPPSAKLTSFGMVGLPRVRGGCLSLSGHDRAWPSITKAHTSGIPRAACHTRTISTCCLSDGSDKQSGKVCESLRAALVR